MKTGNVFTAGTKSNVAMVIYGKYGKTENIPLTNPHNNPIPFEQGKTDKFVVKAADVGNVSHPITMTIKTISIRSYDDH